MVSLEEGAVGMVLHLNVHTLIPSHKTDTGAVATRAE